MEDTGPIVVIFGIIVVVVIGLLVCSFRYNEAYQSGVNAAKTGIPASANPHAGDYPWGKIWLEGYESAK